MIWYIRIATVRDIVAHCKTSARLIHCLTNKHKHPEYSHSNSIRKTKINTERKKEQKRKQMAQSSPQTNISLEALKKHKHRYCTRKLKSNPGNYQTVRCEVGIRSALGIKSSSLLQQCVRVHRRRLDAVTSVLKVDVLLPATAIGLLTFAVRISRLVWVPWHQRAAGKLRQCRRRLEAHMQLSPCAAVSLCARAPIRGNATHHQPTAH